MFRVEDGIVKTITQMDNAAIRELFQGNLGDALESKLKIGLQHIPR